MENITSYVKIAAYIGAAFAIGLGTMGPALGIGSIGAKGCENVGKYPQSYTQIRTMMIIAMSFVEALAIYAFLVSMILIFFT